MENITLKMLE